MRWRWVWPPGAWARDDRGPGRPSRPPPGLRSPATSASRSAPGAAWHGRTPTPRSAPPPRPRRATGPGGAVQPAAGVEITRHIGEQVRAGDVLARLHTDTPERIARAAQAIDGAWDLAAVGTVVPERRIVLDRIA